MSVPPQIVRIKRKKDEDPVDALYIEKHQHQRKRRVTDFVFRRVTEGVNQDGRRSFSRGVPPSIRTTKPGDEFLDDVARRMSKEQRDRSTQAPTSTAAVPDTINWKEDDPPESTSLRRRFHLTVSLSGASFPRKSASGISKRKRSDKPAVATFVEKNTRPARAKSQTRLAEGLGRAMAEAEGRAETVVLPAERPQKRPNASAAEKAWRAENWGDRSPREKSPSSMKPSTKAPNMPSTEIIAQMQEMALQEINQPSHSTSQTSLPSQSKISPKIPSQRYADRHPEPQSTNGQPTSNQDTDMDHDSDSDYVFDLYIREPAASLASPATDPSTNSGKAADPDYGLLVITEESLPEWESYVLDDEESEKDYNTDEDDENAEDYYANDYPDDEVDPDDEDGLGAYSVGRRRGRKSDEEFDEDDDWSHAGHDVGLRPQWEGVVKDEGTGK